VTIIQRALEKQIGVHISAEDLVPVYEWTMAGRPSEYLYCALLDNPAIKITSTQYTTFRWVPLRDSEASNLLPTLKEIIFSCKKEIEKVLE
jgi:hypothetical protein